MTCAYKGCKKFPVINHRHESGLEWNTCEDHADYFPGDNEEKLPWYSPTLWARRIGLFAAWKKLKGNT